MKYKLPLFNSINEMAYIDVCRLTEDEARNILEQIRWKDEIECPHSNSKNITRIKGKSKKGWRWFITM